MNISFEEYKELRSKQRSASISEGLEKSYQQGMSKVANRKCFGYETDAEGHLVIDPEKAEIVRWIFSSFLSGTSYGKIASLLTEQGVLTATGGSKWSAQAIKDLLSNEKYIGQVQLRKTVTVDSKQIINDGHAEHFLYKDHHEPIISVELFDAVQAEIARRAKK